MPPATDVPDDRIHGEDLGPSPARERTIYETPPAPPAPPGAGRVQRASQARGRWFGVAAVGAALLVAGNGGVCHSSTERQTAERAISEIVVDGSSADVEVVGGSDPGKVEIIRQLRWGLGGSQPERREDWSGDVLRIGEVSCGGFSWSCSVDYTIRVPTGTSLKVSSGSGDLSLAGTLGKVELDSGSGDIEADDLTVTELRAESGSGDLDLGLFAAASMTDVRTGSGDVKLRVPEGSTFQAFVETGSGDADLDVIEEPASQHVLQVRTGSGDIDVDYR